MDKERKRFFGYARVSTDAQTLGPKVQQEKILAWLKAQQDMHPNVEYEFGGMFVDEAVSSRIEMLRRPAGNALMIAAGPGDTIVCATMSRAFRSASEAELTLEKLADAKVRMIFLDCNIDTGTPSGKMFLGILAVICRFERDMIRERTVDSLQYRVKNGRPAGGTVPIGWKIIHRNIDGKKVKMLGHCNEARACAAAAKQLIMADYGIVGTMRELQKMALVDKRLRLANERSSNWMTNAAVASCLEYPRAAIKVVKEILGKEVYNLSFIKFADHKAELEKLRKGLRERGYTYV